MTNNNTQKKLIEILTKTHQDPAKAYKMAISQVKEKAEAEKIGRIAEALQIKL